MARLTRFPPIFNFFVRNDACEKGYESIIKSITKKLLFDKDMTSKFNN